VQKKERMSSSDEELIKLLPALKEELKEAADDGKYFFSCL
jgi:hypothetical protein